MRYTLATATLSSRLLRLNRIGLRNDTKRLRNITIFSFAQRPVLQTVKGTSGAWNSGGPVRTCIPGGALALGGIGVLIPIYLGRGPGSTEGMFKPSTKLCGGDRERSVGGRDGPGMGSVAADSEGISKVDLNSVNALMSMSL